MTMTRCFEMCVCEVNKEASCFAKALKRSESRQQKLQPRQGKRRKERRQALQRDGDLEAGCAFGSVLPRLRRAG